MVSSRPPARVGVAPWGPEPPARLGAQAQLCSSREDSRACVIEQLCYGCRVNMKDVVSRSHSWVVTGGPPPGAWCYAAPCPRPFSVAALLGLPATLHLGRGPTPQPKVWASHMARGAPEGSFWAVAPAGQIPSVRLSLGPRQRSRSICWRTVDDEAHASGSGAWGPPEQEGNDGQTACDCINKNIFN